MIKKEDIVAIDGDNDDLAVVWKLVPDTDLVIVQKFNLRTDNRSFLSTTRLTVVDEPIPAQHTGKANENHHSRS
jgi:hypothetical protein